MRGKIGRAAGERVVCTESKRGGAREVKGEGGREDEDTSERKRGGGRGRAREKNQVFSKIYKCARGRITRVKEC